jgi:nucleoside-diphosphate-sugar epimerase
MNLENQKVLVTGAAGYVGSVLIRQLLKSGYFTRGLDMLLFGGESLIDIYNDPKFEFIRGDIRDRQTLLTALDSVGAVLHLAAIVGDPACAKQPQLAEETNWDASRMLFDLCVENKTIKRFVFASTCSNYGKMQDGMHVNENSPLHPLSLYAELKVKFERHLLESGTRKDFIPTALRFGTVYGLSPRMRFDLTVNTFVRDLTIKKELEVYGPQFWRPYVHVEDAASAYIHVLESDGKKVDHNVFNVGDTTENYQKKMLIDEMLNIIPGANIKYFPKDDDPRDFKVDFSKIKNELGWSITKRISDGIREMYSALKNGLITEPFSSKYREI